jgi:uncharacterized protein YchJ
MRNYVVFVTVLTLIPSIYLAYDIVGRSIFNRNTSKFITEEFISKDHIVIDKQISPKDRTIELFVMGEKIDSTEMKLIRNKLVNYNLFDTNLTIRQNTPGSNTSSSLEMMKTGIIEEMYTRNELNLVQREKQINELQTELSKYRNLEQMSDEVSKEITVQYPEVIECSMNKTVVFSNENKADTTVIVLLNTKKKISKSSLEKMNRWLRLRLKEEKVKILTY